MKAKHLNYLKMIGAFLLGILVAWLYPRQSLRSVPLIGMGMGFTFYLNLFQSYLEYRKQMKSRDSENKQGFFVLILPSPGWYQFLKYTTCFLLGLGITAFLNF